MVQWMGGFICVHTYSNTLMGNHDILSLSLTHTHDQWNLLNASFRVKDVQIHLNYKLFMLGLSAQQH